MRVAVVLEQLTDQGPSEILQKLHDAVHRPYRQVLEAGGLRRIAGG
jgi:hypothetical protein